MGVKKLTWEVEKTSLVLKVTDGAKETTWKLRKSFTEQQLAYTFTEMLNEICGGYAPSHTEREATWKEQGSQPVQAASEEASRAAQAARVRELNIGAKWFETDDDETYGIPIPDYDTGEI